MQEHENYFKLRDLVEAFDIGVTWDNKTKTIGIDTTPKLLIYNDNGYKNILWKQEVVLAIGDGLVNLGVSVFKIDYHSKDLDAIEIGCFQGQENIHIDKNNNIIIPFGGQGLFEQYKYHNENLLKLNSNYIEPFWAT